MYGSPRGRKCKPPLFVHILKYTLEKQKNKKSDLIPIDLCLHLHQCNKSIKSENKDDRLDLCEC
jgi:hypothetical protein